MKRYFLIVLLLQFMNGINVPGNESSSIKKPMLEELDLSGNKTANVDQLSRLTSLQRLAVGKNSAENLNFLAPLKKLTHLDVSEIRAKDISALANLKNLAQLKMRALPKLDFSILNELENLADFSIAGSLAGDASIFKSLFFKRLKKLSITGNNLDISVISQFDQLEHLEISFAGVKEVAPLSALKSLKTLILTNNNIRAPLKTIFLWKELYYGIKMSSIDTIQ